MISFPEQYRLALIFYRLPEFALTFVCQAAVAVEDALLLF